VLNRTDKIFENFDTEPFSVTRFIKKNIRGILGTLMFHMFLLIVFLLLKIQGFKQSTDLDVLLDYSQVIELPKEDKKFQLSEAEKAYLDRVIAQSENTSNRASNTSEMLDKELSTENFVNEYLQELDKARSEEWKKQQEEINSKLRQEDYVPPLFDEKKEVDMDEYSGPSNVSYEFLQAPFNRFKTYLPVPVYKCQGDGVVTVLVEVDQTGKVVSAEATLSQDNSDMDCLLEVATNYALRTRFEGSLQASKNHKARITYKFIAQ